MRVLFSSAWHNTDRYKYVCEMIVQFAYARGITIDVRFSFALPFTKEVAIRDLIRVTLDTNYILLLAYEVVTSKIEPNHWRNLTLSQNAFFRFSTER